MSYILDALRKSEQQRRQQQGPDVVNPVSAPQPSRRPLLAWSLTGLVLINLGAVLYLLNSSKGDVPAPTSPLSRPQGAKAGAGGPRQGGLERATLSPTAPAQRVLNEAALADAERSIAERVHPARIPAGPQAPGRAGHDSTASPEQPAVAVAEKVPEPEREVARVRSVIHAPVPAEPAAKIQLSEEVPLLQDMAPDFRRSVPTLRINVYVYAENPSDRFVVVNMAKYRSGQQLADGLVLEEIRPDSMVLSYRDRRFRVERP